MNTYSNVFFLLLALSACAVDSPDALALEPGQPAPSCPMKTWEGAPLDLSQYKGKVVYLDFWASWCAPCAQSFPFMNEMQSDLGPRGLQIIALNLDEKFEDAQAFLAKHPAGFTLARDPENICPKLYEVQGMPSTYLVDPAGKISYVHKGYRVGDADKIRSRVKALLDSKTPN